MYRRVVCIVCILFHLHCTTTQKLPYFISQMQIKFVFPLGTEFQVSCPLEGASFYEWTHQQQPKALSSERVYKGTAVKVTQSEEDAQYKCQGINGFGKTAASVYIHVVDLNSPHIHQRCSFSKNNLQDIGPCFMEEVPATTQRIFVSPGGSVQLNCSAASNRMGPIQYTWTEQNLQQGRRSTSLTESLSSSSSPSPAHLLLHPITPQHHGNNYTCSAAQDERIIQRSFFILLSDENKPKLSGSVRKNVTVPLGDNVRLTCDIHTAKSTFPGQQSEGPPIKWLKQIHSAPMEAGFSNMLDNNSRNLVHTADGIYEVLPTGRTDNFLMLHNVDASHAGFYICSSISNAGESPVQYIHLLVTADNDVDNPMLAMESNLNSRLIIYVSIPLFIFLLCTFFLVYCAIQRRRHRGRSHIATKVVNYSHTLSTREHSSNNSNNRPLVAMPTAMHHQHHHHNHHQQQPYATSTASAGQSELSSGRDSSNGGGVGVLLPPHSPCDTTDPTGTYAVYCDNASYLLANHMPALHEEAALLRSTPANHNNAGIPVRV